MYMYYTDECDGVDSNENLKKRPNSNSFVSKKKLKCVLKKIKKNGPNVFQTFLKSLRLKSGSR